MAAVWQQFDAFLDDLDRHPPDRRPCRVFVSHQSRDVAPAERLAWLATQAGFEYWLDVHDPILTMASVSNLAAPTKAFAIAAIIEMALVNCSHVLSVQTANSRSSHWVPYEFGRGKRPIVTSTQAASWFEPGFTLDPNGDYLALGRIVHTEQGVSDWLDDEMKKGRCD
jgi:hypothetical protein